MLGGIQQFEMDSAEEIWRFQSSFEMELAEKQRKYHNEESVLPSSGV